MHLDKTKDEFMTVLINPEFSDSIANVPKYRTGEFYWSYLNRLSQANGFDNALEYLSLIFHKNIEDTNNPGFVFGAVMDPDGKPIAQSSVFDILKYFLNRQDLIGLYKVYSEEIRNMNSLNDMIYPCRVMKVCPECYKEDMKKGSFIYRTIHQVPGLNICPKHGCNLLQYQGVIGMEFEDPEYEELDSSEIDMKIADIVMALYLTERDFCITEIKTALCDRIRNRYGNDKPLELYRMFSEENDLDEKTRDNKDRFFRLFKLHDSFMDIPFILKVLAKFFDSGEDLLQAIPEQTELDEKVFRHCIDKRYELISKYSHESIKVKCLNCGYEYWTTEHELYNGKGCTACKSNRLFQNYNDKTRKTDNALEQSMVDIDKEYKVIKVRKGMATILHKPCGKVFSMDAKDFYKNPHCHECNGKNVTRTFKSLKLIDVDFGLFDRFKGVPVCDSLLYDIGLSNDPGESSVTVFGNSFVNELVRTKKRSELGNVFAMRGELNCNSSLQYAFLDTLHHYSYASSWNENKAYELAYWMKSHGITEESLKNIDLPVYSSSIKEAISLMKRV